jgi:hypothetical protein
MSRSFLFLLFTLFTTISVTAQDDTAERKANLLQLYNKEGIYLSPRYWQGNTYVKHGVWAPVGAFGRGLSPDMVLSPAGTAALTEVRNNVIGSRVASTLSCLSILAIDYGRDPNTTSTVTVLSLALTLDALVAQPLRLKGQRKLHNAVWLRNRDLLFGQSAGNDPLLDIYNREAIQLYPTYWGNAKYMKNNKVLDARGYAGALKQEFNAVPEAKVLYEAARKNRSASNVTGWISGGAMIGGYSMMLSGIANRSNSDGRNSSANRQQVLGGLGLVLAGMVTNIAVAIPLKFQSERQLSEAVYLRNRAVLFGK